MATFQIGDVRRYMDIVAKTHGLGPDIVATILKDHGDGAPDANNLNPRRYDAVVYALIDALNRSQYKERLESENPWRLATDHPRFLEATETLCAVWRQARELGTRDAAEAQMRACLAKYDDVGATGPEARGELYSRLHERFGSREPGR